MTETAAPAPVTTGVVPLVVVAGCVALAGVWASESLAAVPAGAGLTALAWSDGQTHRFSLRTMVVCTALTVACLAAEAVSATAWSQVLSASIIVVAVGAGALCAWLSVRGIAFGDVSLIVFALLVPSWVGPATAAVTILLAFIAAGAIVVVRRRGRIDGSPPLTVAFAPALLAGWVVGLTAL